MQRRWTSEIGQAKREKKSESQVARNEPRSNSTDRKPYLKYLFWGWPRSLSPRAYTYHEFRKRLPRTEREEEAKERRKRDLRDGVIRQRQIITRRVASRLCWKQRGKATMNPHGFAAVSCHLHTLDESGVINGANANFTAVPWNWNGCRSPKSV